LYIDSFPYLEDRRVPERALNHAQGRTARHQHARVAQPVPGDAPQARAPLRAPELLVQLPGPQPSSIFVHEDELARVLDRS
jgi:hypothetical protein